MPSDKYRSNITAVRRSQHYPEEMSMASASLQDHEVSREGKRAPSPITAQELVTNRLALLDTMALQLFWSNFEYLITLRLIILSIWVRLANCPAEPCKWCVARKECGLDIPVALVSTVR